MKFLFICEFVPSYKDQNPELCQILSGLLKKVCNYIFKISEDTYPPFSLITENTSLGIYSSIERLRAVKHVFWDIDKMYSDANLQMSKDCYSIETAFLYWLTLHPTPPEVYNYLPVLDNYFSNIAEDGTVKNLIFPSLSSEARKIVKNELSLGSAHCIGGEHITFYNYQRDFFSCATRLYKLLGLDTISTEWGVDVHKYGITSQLFCQHLLLSWFPGCKIVNDKQSICTGDEQLNSAHNMIWSAIGSNSNDSLPAVHIVIYLQADHVSFSIGKMFLSKNIINTSSLYHGNRRKEDAGLDATSIQLLRKALEESFMPVTGRAGAKVFIPDLSYLKHILNECTDRELLLQIIKNLLEMTGHDWGLTTVHGLLLSTIVDNAGGDILVMLAMRKEVYNPSLAKAAKELKAIHTSGRLFYSLTGVAKRFYPVNRGRAFARCIYGLDTIVGRSDKLPLDSKGEMLMRTVDPFTRGKLGISSSRSGLKYLTYDTTEKYAAFLKAITRESFSTLLKDKTHAESFKHWYSRRMYWGASGGAPGSKITWYGENGKEEKLRLNKRGALIALKPYKITKLWKLARHGSGEKVIQFSKKATKFESGKLRAILNTSVENYVSQAYLQDQFHENIRDDLWYSYGHSTTGRISNAIRRLSDLRRMTPLMWDYSDFNINHTYYNMSLGYLYTGEIILDRLSIPKNSKLYIEIEDNIRDDVRYLIQARFNTYLADDELNLVIKAVRSLQSGERATSDINTTQNDIAVRVVEDASVRLLGLNTLDKVGDRAGDDAFLLCVSLFYASLTCALFNLTGEAGQVFKINVNCIKEVKDSSPSKSLSGGGSGEFLRLAYDGNTNTISGYPLRAMMGFIHGEFFAEPIPDPPSRAATLLEQVSKLSRRGWQTPNWLFTQVLKQTCTLVHTNKSGEKIRFTPDPTLVTMPRCFGGYGVSETNEGLPATIGAKNGFIKPIMRQVAIYIPSGEGKTSLARLYPEYFLDHDQLVNPFTFTKLKEKAQNTGDWSICNNYLKKLVADYIAAASDERVILSWGPDTVPSELHPLAIAILNRNSNGIRANVANRQSIRDRCSRKTIHYVRTFANTISIALSLVSGRLAVGRNWLVTVNSNSLPPPKFKNPQVSSLNLLKASKPSNFIDMTALHKKGLAMPPDVADAIITSALTGGWPKQDLNSSLAEYARELTSWTKASTVKVLVMSCDELLPNRQISSWLERNIPNYLGLVGYASDQKLTKFKVNQEGYPITKKLRHTYNSISSFMRPLGCSVLPTLYHLIDATEGPTRLHKLRNLAQQKISEYDRGMQEVTKLSELVTQCNIYLNVVRINEQGTRPEKISDADRAYCTFAFDWLDGGLDFIPTHNPGIATDLASFGRDLTIKLVDVNCDMRKLATINKRRLSLSVHWLERMVILKVIETLNTYCPGIIYKD